MEYFGDNYYLVDGKFWEAFEFFYKLKLPVYLKNVLSVNGYGCISTFCKITGSCFEAIEETIRSFHQCEQKGTVDTLHLYRDAPALFKIVPGHRELLLEYSVKLASQQNEFNEVLASRLSMEISPQPQLMSASSTVNSREYQNPSSHMRIINQLITTKLEVPKNVHLNIRIVDDNSAKISCFQCEQEVDIKTKILSATNRHWMIGKYIKHIEMHSKLDQPPQGSSQDRSLPEDSDSENEIELSDEMDRRVLELKYRQKTLRSSSNFSMTRSLKRNIKMTTEVAHDVKQRKITRYFSSATTKQSEDVKYSPRDSIQDDNKLFLGLLEKLPLTNMMKTMIRETITNGYKNIITAKSEAKGARYTTESKNIGAYFYLMGGKKDYEELVVNLGLPSLSTILRHIRKSCNKIVEGQLRIGKLLEFLEARNLPKIVFISEDGTKISPRVRYDIASDQIAGLCPRLDSNGIPEIGSFPAKTPELIKNHMEMNPKSTMVYVVLATPMTTKTLSFNLLSFGTNNKFSIDEVLLRWGIMEKEMEKKGITIIGYGADGDSRLIGSMKIRMGLPRTIELFEIPSNWDSWYAAKGQTGVVYVQDSTHIVNKLKNCLLSYTRNLQIGKLIIC
ncbi:uncharacterized protein LOC134219622 [Armigeres subalbatus]|uniref:uncharacterized protein LOC134219622 n=1 Tax=Armigeres subalbatus TaxID=124917 RepID=UPI002ED14F15